MAIMNVEQFKGNITGGGARPNYFKVFLNLAQYGARSEDTASFLCKAASIPASIVEPITVPFRGREIKVSGDRRFDPWTITVINDIDFGLRRAFENWSNEYLNRHAANTSDQRPASYKEEMTVEQLEKDGTSLMLYRFIGCFPSNIDPIELSYDSSNQVEDFSVTIEYDYWLSEATDSDS